MVKRVQKIENIVFTRMVCFWNKLGLSNSDKLSFNIYRLMEHLHDEDIYKSKWCGKVRQILDNTGLSYIWN